MVREKVSQSERKLKKAQEEEKNDIISLFFQRTDKLDENISLKTTLQERMELVVKRAARELGITNSKIGVLMEGQPISFRNKTVKDVIKKHDAVSYQISSADMLGAWQGRERVEEEEGKQRESDELSTPPTGAGLMRFYEEETGGPPIGGKGVMILAMLLLGSVLGAWFLA